MYARRPSIQRAGYASRATCQILPYEAHKKTPTNKYHGYVVSVGCVYVVRVEPTQGRVYNNRRCFFGWCAKLNCCKQHAAGATGNSHKLWGLQIMELSPLLSILRIFWKPS